MLDNVLKAFKALCVCVCVCVRGGGGSTRGNT